MPSDSKSILLSKTVWANVVALIVAIAGTFGINIGLTPEAQGGIVLGILAVVNIILRGVTTGPVHVIAPAAPAQAAAVPPSAPPAPPAGPTP